MSTFLKRTLFVCGGIFAIAQITAVCFPRYYVWRMHKLEERTGEARRTEEASRPQSRFTKAVLEGKSAEVRTLLLDGADPNVEVNGPSSALAWASSVGDTETLRVLLDGGARVDKANADGWTPLIGAAGEGHEEVVDLLIIRGADVNARTKDGTTAVMSAAWMGHEPIVLKLIHAGAKLNLLTSKHESAATLAARGGHPTILRLLRKKGSADLPSRVWEGRTEEVLSLIKSGVPFDERDKNGWTAFLVAARQGNLRVVKALIKAGAEVNAENANETALTGAIAQKSLPMVDVLLAAGYDVRAKRKANDNALRVAILTRQDQMVTRLLAVRCSFGSDILFEAVQRGSVATVKEFLKAGADVNVASAVLGTPLIASAENGYPSMAKLLIGAGAEVNMKDGRGWNALMAAADQGFLDVVTILAEARSQPGLKELGLTPQDVLLFGAVREGGDAHAEKLLKAGANPNAKIRASLLTKAATKGDLSMVKMLLLHGAAVNEGRCCPAIPAIRSFLMRVRISAEAGNTFEEVIQTLKRAGANEC